MEIPMQPSSPPHAPRPGRKAAAWVVGVGLLVTGICTAAVWLDAVQRDRERLAALTEQVRQEIETRVEGYERELRGLADWFGERAEISEAEWEKRIERMNLPVNLPAARELLFAKTVRDRSPAAGPPRPSQLGFGRDLEVLGWDFEVTHSARRTGYSRTNWALKQMDFLPAPQPRWLMAELDSDHLNRIIGTLSARSTGRRLDDSADGSPGFTLLAGVYGDTMTRASEITENDFLMWHRLRNERRIESLKGAVAVSILVEPLLDSIFGGRSLEVEFDLHSGPVSETNRLTRPGSPPLRPVLGLSRTQELRWYGDRWQLTAVPNRRFLEGSLRLRALLVGGAGLALSLALAGFVQAQVRARIEAETWGRDLEAAREQLRVAYLERDQFGRNLHDGVLQSLYAAVLSLRRARRATSSNPPAAGPLIEEVVGSLEESMQTIRGFLTSAPAERPRAAELPGLLRGYVAACNRLPLAEVSIAGQPEVLGLLTDGHAEQVLPLLKEAVSNAQRHGQASRIEIRCEREGDTLRLTVTDDGCGFTPDTADGSGYGLRSMHERMAHCGGTCVVESRPGGPTAVRATLPIRHGSEAAQ